MIRRLLPVTMLALSAPAAMSAGQPPGGQAIVGQVTIHERLVIRVPRTPVRYPPGRDVVAPPPPWHGKKGPKCVGIGEIAAAAIVAPATVDLLLDDGRRVRARLDHDCRSADFYAGLYIRPGADGRVCARRDAIRVRSGAACGIDAFQALATR